MTVTIVDAARPVPGGVDAHLDLNVASRLVTGGVDTHLDVNVAAALDGIGGLLAVAEFPATLAGHRALLGWLPGFGPVARAGVEGTGSYGAGLARFLRAAGVAVVEVDRPNRQARRCRHGIVDAGSVGCSRPVAHGETGLGDRRCRWSAGARFRSSASAGTC